MYKCKMNAASYAAPPASLRAPCDSHRAAVLQKYPMKQLLSLPMPLPTPFPAPADACDIDEKAARAPASVPLLLSPLPSNFQSLLHLPQPHPSKRPAVSPAAAAPPSSMFAQQLKMFAQQLRAAGLSDDDAALERLAALGGVKGVIDMEDLHGFNEAEVRASVEHMLLTPMQLRKLLECLCAQGATPPSNSI